MILWSPDTSLVAGVGPVNENQSGEELVERYEAGIDDFMDIGPNTTAGGEGTFRERFAENIKTLREFCDGLEYQIQFEDRRMLEAIERDGSSMCRLAQSCLSRERCMDLTRGQSPTMWERETTTMFCPPRVDNDHADRAPFGKSLHRHSYTNSQSHNIITTIILSFSTSLSVLIQL